MKKALLFLLIFSVPVALFSCSKDKPEGAEVLALINDYHLTLHDFESQLAEELELEQDFKLTQEAKHEFLEGLIRKQLLIQEAKKMELDTKEAFVRSIQSYWESTLIKNLIELKSNEIDKIVYVSQEEIEARYNQVTKAEGTPPPLVELQESLKEEIKERKKTKRLKIWINELRKKADIKIDEALL